MVVVEMAAPARSFEQRMAALECGNAIRSYRAQLKADLKAQRRLASSVLGTPADEVLTMKVWDLLLAIPKVGRVKANKWLRQARISPAKTVGGLSERQRADLLAIIGCRVR